MAQQQLEGNTDVDLPAPSGGDSIAPPNSVNPQVPGQAMSENGNWGRNVGIAEQATHSGQGGGYGAQGARNGRQRGGEAGQVGEYGDGGQGGYSGPGVYGGPGGHGVQGGYVVQSGRSGIYSGQGSGQGGFANAGLGGTYAGIGTFPVPGQGAGKYGSAGVDGPNTQFADNMLWAMQSPFGPLAHTFVPGMVPGPMNAPVGRPQETMGGRPGFENISNLAEHSGTGQRALATEHGHLLNAQTDAAPPVAAMAPNVHAHSAGPGTVQLVMTQEEFNAAVAARVRDEVAKHTFVQNKRTARIHVRPEVRHAVRQCALRLMDCTKKVPSPHPRLKPYYPLPAPLPAGAERRKDRDGNDLWNPEWDQPVDQGVNIEFIDALVAMVLQTGAVTYRLKPRWLAEPAMIKRAAQTHFRHLRREYNYRKDENGIRRLLRRKTKDDRHSRRTRKANRRRKAIPPFRKAFGRAETKGVEELVRTPLMSSEASSDGEADPAERSRMREEQNAGRRALETRTMICQGDQLNRVYAALDAFARVQEANDSSSSPSRSSGDSSSDSDSSESSEDADGMQGKDDDIDLPELERAQYRAQVAAKIQAAQAGDSQMRYDRFRGPRANYRTSLRQTKKPLVIYKECLNAKWASQSIKNQRTYDRAERAPGSMTIFKLRIPDEFFLSEDRGYLADSEKGFEMEE